MYQHVLVVSSCLLVHCHFQIFSVYLNAAYCSVQMYAGRGLKCSLESPFCSAVCFRATAWGLWAFLKLRLSWAVIMYNFVWDNLIIYIEQFNISFCHLPTLFSDVFSIVLGSAGSFGKRVRCQQTSAASMEKVWHDDRWQHVFLGQYLI